ncbi:heparinase II/III family protein [Streptomyces sp. DSM 116494]|uniref:heparinase II/III domain-containing protein n=1 Tax=Streptomyces okerensis TaxID=3344655 RepID=UPI0038900A52
MTRPPLSPGTSTGGSPGSRFPPPPRHTFPDAGFAVFRSAGVHALLDAGPHGGGHGHQDKLSLYLYADDGTAWQPDSGQVPYAHRNLRRHYASTFAHPTFRVDGTEQRPCDAVLDGDTAGASRRTTASRRHGASSPTGATCSTSSSSRPPPSAGSPPSCVRAPISTSWPGGPTGPARSGATASPPC